jgi:hypothetical protein
MSGFGSERPDSQLRRRRDELADEVAELHWSLGGLTYEMAIRDHFRLDVLVRRAAILQERDAELAEVERMLHMQESGSAGDCPSCGAVRSRGAVFCWQCGAQVMERSSAGGNGHHRATQSVQASQAPSEVDITAQAPASTSGSTTIDTADSADGHDLGRPVQTGP